MSFEEKFLIKVIKLHKYDEDYYSEVLATTQIPHYFFMDNCEHFNDDHLVQYCQLEEKTIQHFIDENVIEIETLLEKQQFSLQQLKTYIQNDNVNWDLIPEFQNIPCNILQINKDLLNWDLITENQYMDLEFLISNINNIKWNQLPFNGKMNQYINEGIITLFQQTNIWDNIGYCDAITLETMLKYDDKFSNESWQSIIDHRELDDETIEEYRKKLI